VKGTRSSQHREINERIRRLRNHGAIKPFVHVEVGTNSRLDEIQAAALRLKLRQIDKALACRRNVAAAYTQRLGGTAVVPPPLPAAGEHAFNLYTIRTPDRNRVRQALTDQKIGTSQCYPEGLHLQEVYRHLGYKAGSLPVCEQATTETLSLPIYPDMPPSHIDRVCDVVLATVGR